MLRWLLKEAGARAVPSVADKPWSWKLLAATGVAYLITAAGSTIAFGTITPVWYSNAIILVPILLQPVRSWPIYLGTALVLNAAVIHFFGSGHPFLLSLPDALEVALAASAIRLTGGISYPIFAPVQVARLVAVCVLAPAASALIAAIVITNGQLVGLSEIWRNWYLGAMLGLLIGTLFLLSWTDPSLRPRRVSPSWKTVGSLAFGVLLAAYLVQNTLHEVLLLLTFPIVFAITWRYGLVGATLATAGVTVATLWATTRGHGAIVQLLSPGDMKVRMEGAQVFLGSMLLSTLPLAVLRVRQRDLTESVRRASDARTEFLAAMSHEIRTPMTGVLGLVDLLAEEPLNERQQGYVDALRLSGRHLLSIINDILDFSRIETGKLDLELVNFTLAELLEQVRSVTHPLAVERGLALTEVVELPVATPFLGDELRLRQVLLNLVSNAIKFTEEGTVQLRVAKRAADESGRTWLQFEVHDTGVGIAEDKLEFLFTPFTQADQSTARQYGGSGLGLAISKRLVEAMGGSISASSVAGKGSVFGFEVPLGQGEHAVPESRGTPAQVRPLRILIAEDVQINREILRAALGKAGHHLAFALDGREALEQVQAASFDVVLMDVQMPNMDGVEATRQIRALGGRFAELPIIGLTANVMARERGRYAQAGMNDCLAKPIDWELLAHTLGRHAGVDPVSAPAAAATAPSDATLIDEAALDMLRQIANAEELKVLLDMGLAGCEKSLDALLSPDRTAESTSTHSHKLKGAAGQLGMIAVARLAAQIEQLASEGHVAGDLIALAQDALDRTRAELHDKGVL